MRGAHGVRAAGGLTTAIGLRSSAWPWARSCAKLDSEGEGDAEAGDTERGGVEGPPLRASLPGPPVTQGCSELALSALAGGFRPPM